MNTISRTSIGIGLIGFVSACNDGPNRPVETADAEEYESHAQGTPVSGPAEMENPSIGEATASSVSNDTRSAMDSIAEARCAREAKCDNIGSEKDYSSTEDCLARIKDEWRDDLNARECPGGVDEPELDECLTAIRDDECGNPFDTLSRVAECGAGQICID